MRAGLHRSHLTAREGLAAVAWLSLSVTACADFAAIPPGVCGNDVVELDRGEDCDTHAPEVGTHCVPPSAPHACHYICNSLTPCPTGWGCAANGVCRLGSGEFEELSAPVSFPALQQLQVGDFDGDDLPDLLLLDDNDFLGRRAAQVIYAPARGGAGNVAPIPGRVGVPVTGQLNSDATTDVAFADVDGISVFHGEPTRSAQLAVFPFLVGPEGTHVRGIPIDVIPDDPGDEIVAFVEPTRNLVDKKAWLTRPKGNLDEAYLVEVPGGEADLAGDIVWGKLNEDAKCPQVVLPYAGRDTVPFFTPCKVMGKSVEWNVGGALDYVTLPAGATVDRGVRLADLDRDGHLDLLIGASESLFAAWGRGDGTFVSAKAGGMKGEARPYVFPAIAGTPSPFPLAVADLNDDNIADYVIPQGVLLSQAGDFALVYANGGVPWTEALITDFNDNGLPDIVAVSFPRVGIDFLNNTGSGTFNPAAARTEGAPSHLVTGDFDGDLVNDIAFKVVGVGATDKLLVAFGADHGPPETPIVVAHIEDVAQIVATRLPDTAGADGITDLVITSEGANQAARLLALRGSSTRLMAGALPLRSGVDPALPLALSIGRFENAFEMAALGVDQVTGELRIWLVEPADQITLTHLTPSEPLSPLFQSSDGNAHPTLTFGAVAAAGDLDGDGIDEVVIAAPWGSPSRAALVIADYDAFSFSFRPRYEQPIATSLSIDSTLVLRDVDGDGFPDGILLGGSDEAPDGLVVFWNDGHGGLGTDTPTKIDVEGYATGFKCALTAASGCQLFVTSPTATYACSVRPDRTVEITPIANVPGGDDLAVADFDRDGTLDLAIANASGYRLFQGIPVNP